MNGTPARRTPLKVCHIAATTEGAIWVFEQLRDLRDRYGYEVAVILNGDQGALVDRFREADIPIHVSDFNFTSNAELLELPRKVIALTRLLRRERFDIIQTHLFHSMVIGRIAAWFADVPVRFSMIAGPFHLEAYTPRWIDRFTCWMDTAIIASCEFTRTLYENMGVARKRLAVIYYGPDEAKFDPSATATGNLREEFGWPADTPLVGMVAYFYAELPHNRWMPPAVQGRSVKSQEDLIRAAPLILREFPTARILLVGNGWEEGGRSLSAADAGACRRAWTAAARHLSGIPDRHRHAAADHRRRGPAVAQRKPRRHDRVAADGMSDRGDAGRRHDGQRRRRRDRCSGGFRPTRNRSRPAFCGCCATGLRPDAMASPGASGCWRILPCGGPWMRSRRSMRRNSARIPAAIVPSCSPAGSSSDRCYAR